MFEKLIIDIRNYILYLEKNGYYISIHTNFSEYMMSLLDFNIHRNPYCIMRKSKNEEWDKCIKEHENITFDDKCRYIINTCHAGLKEYIFKLECGGSVCVSSKDENVVPILIISLIHMIEYLNCICPQNDVEITQNEIVNRALKYLNRNFYNNISNNDIAKFCNCSVSSLCHLFKIHMGIGVRRYLINLRLQYAKELLRASNLSITAISHKSGFSDYNDFISRFKKELHITPGQYRKLHLNRVMDNEE